MNKQTGQRDLPCYNKLLKNLYGEKKWEDIDGTDGFFQISNFGRGIRISTLPANWNKGKPYAVKSNAKNWAVIFK